MQLRLYLTYVAVTMSVLLNCEMWNFCYVAVNKQIAVGTEITNGSHSAVNYSDSDPVLTTFDHSR